MSAVVTALYSSAGWASNNEHLVFPQPKILENQEIQGRERKCMLFLFNQLFHLCIKGCLN